MIIVIKMYVSSKNKSVRNEDISHMIVINYVLIVINGWTGPLCSALRLR